MKSEEKVIVQQVIMRPLADLVPNPKNPRTATEEEIAALAESIKANPDYFDARPIVLSNRTGVMMIIDGEQRSKAAKLLGMVEVPTILMEGLTEAQEDEIMVRGNTHAGKWDYGKLQVWDKDNLRVWGVVPESIKEAAQKNKYTRKIEIPIYEPKAEMPDVKELFDTTKTDELVAKISEFDLPYDIREFLLRAAERHTVFNYAKIAEYYAHADREVQRLFEDSALVIIDFDDAVAGGYVRMCESLMDIYKMEHDGGE